MFDNYFANMYGPYFLLLYAGAVLAAIIITWLQYRKRFKTGDDALLLVPSNPEPYETAYLRGGAWEVGKLAIHHLLRTGYFKSYTNDSKTKVVLHKTESRPASGGLNVIEHTVYHHFSKPGYKLYDFMDDSRLIHKIETACMPYKEKLEREGLLNGEADGKRWKMFKRVVMIALLLLGAYKLMAAAAHGRNNVTFLWMMMIGTGFLLSRIFRMPRLTGRGNEYLERVQSVYGSKVNEEVKTLSYEQQMMLAGIFGLGMLTMLPYSYIDSHLGRQSSAGWFSGYMGGSSGSCGGGGCGGGGCGGGGCGGCGGCS